MMYRSPKLLQSARGTDCLIQIPNVCNGRSESVVACHANWYEFGKGGALKAHDCFTARGCSGCHYAIDQGKDLTYEEKKHYWLQGWIRTVLAWFQEDIVRVG